MAKKNIKLNYVYNLIYQVLILILPLITTPYLSRILGAENIGIYGFTLSISSYFILFGSLGISMYGQREIAYVQDDVVKRTKTFYEILFVRFITMFISMVLFALFFCIKGNFVVYYRLLLLELVANTLDISWFFQGMEEFKKTVSRNLVVKILSVVCIFAFVKEASDLYIYFIIYVLSLLIGNLSLWLYLPKFIKNCKLSDINMKRHLLPIISMFVPQIAIQIYTVLDKTMIGVILNDMVEVGYYEQAQKIVKIILSVVTAMGIVMVPRISNLYKKNDKKQISNYLSKIFNFVWFLASPLLFGLIAVSSKVVPWFFGIEFEKVIYLICILAFLIYAIGFNNVIGVQYLISTNNEKVFTKSVIFGAIINFILNIIFIKLFGAIGACISSVIAETSILIYQIVYISKNKDFEVKIIFNNCYKYIFAAIIMCFVTYLVGYRMQPVILTTVIQVIVGGLTYFILLIIFRDQFLLKYLKQILNLVKGKIKS